LDLVLGNSVDSVIIVYENLPNAESVTGTFVSLRRNVENIFWYRRNNLLKLKFFSVAPERGIHIMHAKYLWMKEKIDELGAY